MNAAQANSTISIYAYLINEGFIPARENEREAWFAIRNEVTASCKVDKTLNRFYDHGVGFGGKVTDICMLINSCDVRNALAILSGCSLPRLQRNSMCQQLTKVNVTTEVKSIGRIIDRRLQAYLKTRCIPLRLANNYCCQITYSFGGREYVTIGFKNNAGGFATRNKYSKRCIGPNDISCVRPHETRVILTEGFLDYLSAIVLNPMVANYGAIVLNSTANISRCVEQLSVFQPKVIYVAFDNDNSGRDASLMVNKLFPFAKDVSHRYKLFKDINEKLTNLKNEKAKVLR